MTITELGLLLVAVAAVLFCGLTVFFCRRTVEKTYSAIDGVLDGFFEQNTDAADCAEEENRLSKLRHKAARLARQSRMDASRTSSEKESIQSFLSELSHQMKTPLSGVSMYSELLLEGGLSGGEQQEFLTRIKQGADKLEWMLSSLLKLSRLEIGAITLTPVPAGIRQTVSDSISAVRAAADKKNISLLTEEYEDRYLLHDRKWTTEALTNLLENAVKYSEPEGKVELSVEVMPIFTKINVTDTGTGIPREEWSAVFKRFYRGQNAKEKEGAGLGLYLASMILEMQGGYILVDSRPGAGTTFSLFLQNCEKAASDCQEPVRTGV